MARCVSRVKPITIKNKTRPLRNVSDAPRASLALQSVNLKSLEAVMFCKMAAFFIIKKGGGCELEGIAVTG